MPLHGLGVCRHSQHRPGLPMRQSWCSDGQYQCPGCLWPSPALCPGCWPQACTQARPHSAQRTWQPSNTVTVSTAGRLQPGIGAGYRNNWQDILSYTCPQVTLTLSPVPLIFPAAHNRGSYWVRPYSNCYATPEYAHYAHPVASCGNAVISAVSGVRSTHPARCGFVDISSIPGVHPPRPPPLLQLWLPHLSLENAHHARPSTSCGYVASHQSQEYAHHTQPVVAMWLSHPSLEYAHHAHLFAYASCGYVAISPIPGIRTPRPARCGYVAIWLSHPSLEYAHLFASAYCGYLTYPWSTHTTPSQVWLCGYLTHPWSRPTKPTSVPTVATWLSHISLEYTHHAQPGVAMWLSHLSLEYAHHAHLSTPASCGHVAISLIPGVRTPRPAKCGYVAISPIPGVHPPRPPLCICQLWLRGYLTYPGIMPTTPTLLPAVATWFFINPQSTHTTPSQVCLSHLFLEYALHAHPLPAVAMWLSHLSLEHAHHAYPSIRCGYVALPPIPGVRPTHLAICQVWLRGYLPYHLSTPVPPTLCLRRLRSYHIYPWNTPIPMPAAATRLLTWPWNTPTTPSQPQVWLLCGLLTFHQLGFSG